MPRKTKIVLSKLLRSKTILFLALIALIASAIMLNFLIKVKADAIIGVSYAIVAPYLDLATKGTPNWGYTQAGFREFITIGQRYRIRQNGSITQIKLYTPNTSNLSGFYIKIWRKNGNNYDLVGTSDNLISRFSSGNNSVITLTTPINNVREGDYYGYRVEKTGGGYNFFARTAIPSVNSHVITNVSASETGYNWGSQPRFTGTVLPIELYMQPPRAVFIGDSIMAGHPKNYSFLETSSITNLDATIEKQFSLLRNYSYQNMGIGSQTTTQIAARFNNDVIALKPELIVIDGGVNDIALNNKSAYVANMKTMLETAQTQCNVSRVIVLKILPWTRGTNDQLKKRDDWNKALVDLAKNYLKVSVVDASAYVGQNRPGGDPGNLWDIKPEYNADGVHFNQAGAAQIAKAIADSL